MKHTYLCPLPLQADFLWRLARQQSSELFGYPPIEHKAGWQTLVRLDEELGRARTALLRMLKSAPRVCLGTGYVIPYSELDTSVRSPLAASTRLVTVQCWHAPLATWGLHDRLRSLYTNADDRDPLTVFDDFFTTVIDSGPARIIPVWM